MDENFNPDKIPEDAESSLAGALEGLLQGRFSRADAQHPDSAGFLSQQEPVQQEPVLPHSADSAQCPDPADLVRLLDGAGDPLQQPGTDALMTHLAGCRPCAERMRVLSAEESEEESAALAGLACASASGQRELAAKLARTPRAGSRNRVGRFYVWAGAGLAASLMIAVGLSSWWRAANDPERLMAQAYTASRTFDMRMPGAGFAEVTPERHLRGGSAAQEPAKLVEARKRIEQHLTAAPQDPHWLQLEARSEILAEKFDLAIDILDRQVAAGPASAGLLLDDASAHFQRGVATDSESDRARALDALRRADEIAPGDPVILFNEAVAMEDRGELMNAVETWNRYLRFERDAKWQAEGRSRLEALELKLNQLKSHQN
jgi:tetratricopeptide (TPR) repeat protein